MQLNITNVIRWSISNRLCPKDYLVYKTYLCIKGCWLKPTAAVEAIRKENCLFSN